MTVCDCDNTRGGKHGLLERMLQTLHRLAGPYRPYIGGKRNRILSALAHQTGYAVLTIGKLIEGLLAYLTR